MQFRLHFLAVACTLVLSMLLASSARADVRAIASVKDWKVFQEKIGSDRVCFAVTEARDKAPRDVSHGEVFFYVAAWASGRSKGQASLKVGYDLRGDLPPEVVIGGQRWRMYSAGDEGFLRDDDERAVIRALRRGRELRIEAVSKRNTRTAYHFSLSGSASAIDWALEACS